MDCLLRQLFNLGIVLQVEDFGYFLVAIKHSQLDIIEAGNKNQLLKSVTVTVTGESLALQHAWQTITEAVKLLQKTMAFLHRLPHIHKVFVLIICMSLNCCI